MKDDGRSRGPAPDEIGIADSLFRSPEKPVPISRIGLSLQRFCEEVLPDGTVTNAQIKDFGRDVTGARLLRPKERNPLGVLPERPVMIIVPPHATESLLQSQSIAEFITNLGSAAFVSAFVIPEGEEVAEAKQAALAFGVPLLRVPANVDLEQLEQVVNTQVSIWKQEARQRIDERLRAVSTGEYQQALRALELQLKKPVSLESIAGEIQLVFYDQPSSGLERSLKSKAKLPLPDVSEMVWGVTDEPPVFLQKVSENEVRVIAPIHNGKTVSGWASVWSAAGEASVIDEIALARGARVLALVASNKRVTQERELELHGGLARTLISGSYTSEPELREYAEIMGHSLRGPHAVLAISLQENASQLRLDTTTLWSREGENFAVILPLVTDSNMPLQNQVADWKRRVFGDDAGVKIAFGREAYLIPGIKDSWEEASNALVIANILRYPEQIVNVNNFEILDQLTFSMLSHDRDALVRLRDGVIGQLLDHDPKGQGELLKTLKLYFSSGGNIKQMADALNTHRNTVHYRIKLLDELLGGELKSGSTNIQNAIRIHDVLQVTKQKGEKC